MNTKKTLNANLLGLNKFYILKAPLTCTLVWLLDAIALEDCCISLNELVLAESLAEFLKFIPISSFG